MTPWAERSLLLRPFTLREQVMLFALFLIVTSGTGLTTTLVGNFADRAACENAAKATTVVIGNNATIGFVTICIGAPPPP